MVGDESFSLVETMGVEPDFVAGQSQATAARLTRHLDRPLNELLTVAFAACRRVHNHALDNRVGCALVGEAGHDDEADRANYFAAAFGNQQFLA